MKLANDVQQMLIDEMITPGHARALIGIENPQEQYNLAQKIFDEKLSVREVEKIVKNLQKPTKRRKKLDDKTLLAIYHEEEEKMKKKLGTKVSVVSKGEGTGKIEIEFYNHDDFDRIVELIGNPRLL